jgi:hypothetical protein
MPTSTPPHDSIIKPRTEDTKREPVSVSTLSTNFLRNRSGLNLLLRDKKPVPIRLSYDKARTFNTVLHPLAEGERGRAVVEALCYKPEGLGFKPQWSE